LVSFLGRTTVPGYLGKTTVPGTFSAWYLFRFQRFLVPFPLLWGKTTKQRFLVPFPLCNGSWYLFRFVVPFPLWTLFRFSPRPRRESQDSPTPPAAATGRGARSRTTSRPPTWRPRISTRSDPI